jgi:hypothetical protein
MTDDMMRQELQCSGRPLAQSLVTFCTLKLSAPIDLYIYPLYVLTLNQQDSLLYIQFSRTNPSSISPSIHSIHCGTHLSLYLNISMCDLVFEGFIETNLMVQSKFNLDFWFVSYNIFSFV